MKGSYGYFLHLIIGFSVKFYEKIRAKIRAKIREIEITDTTTDSFNTRNLVEY